MDVSTHYYNQHKNHKKILWCQIQWSKSYHWFPRVVSSNVGRNKRVKLKTVGKVQNKNLELFTVFSLPFFFPRFPTVNPRSYSRTMEKRDNANPEVNPVKIYETIYFNKKNSHIIYAGSIIVLSVPFHEFSVLPVFKMTAKRETNFWTDERKTFDTHIASKNKLPNPNITVMLP